MALPRVYYIPTGSNDNDKTILGRGIWGLPPHYNDKTDMVRHMQEEGGVALFVAPQNRAADIYGIDEAAVYAIARVKGCVEISPELAGLLWKPRPLTNKVTHSNFTHAIVLEQVQRLSIPLLKSELKALLGRPNSTDRMMQAMEVPPQYVQGLLAAVHGRCV